jgi:hypothetical protein
MSKVIVVKVGKTDFTFNVTNRDFNNFIDKSSGPKKVLPAYQFLSDVVENSQHAKLKGLLVDDENQPKAKLVMEVLADVEEVFNKDLPEVVKVQTSSANSSKEMDLSNS